MRRHPPISFPAAPTRNRAFTRQVGSLIITVSLSAAVVPAPAGDQLLERATVVVDIVSATDQRTVGQRHCLVDDAEPAVALALYEELRADLGKLLTTLLAQRLIINSDDRRQP